MLKRPAILFACLLFAALFAFGLVRLFELRFDQGDLYPPYSTLRADPLGTSILYESLERVPGVTARRHFEETFKDDAGHGRALFVLGAQPRSRRWLARSEFDVLQRFVFNGGRVVIAYFPQATESWSSRRAWTNETDRFIPGEKAPGHKKPVSNPDNLNGKKTILSDTNAFAGTNPVTSTNAFVLLNDKKPHDPSRPRNAQEQQAEDELKVELKQYADLSVEWGFHFENKALGTNADGRIQFPDASLVASNRELPARLPIHTVLCFANLTNGWTTVYLRDAKTPVVIERKLGAGSVVLVADAYPFSNEAMFKDRSAPLLAWLLGDGRDAIFDEAHLGIVEQPGVATLMRRYQLHGLIFSLLLVAGLFIWKNSVSLVPPHADVQTEAGPVVAGRDSASGFVNLVRRGIAPADIINLCYAEWNKSNARTAALSPAQRRDLEQLIQQQAALPPRQRRPVENYRVLSRILQRRN